MEDVSLVLDPDTEDSSPATRLIAPWWHTAAILLILAAWAILSGNRKRDYVGMPHVVTYISMMLMSWMLFGATIAGIFDRGAFFFATLRHRAHSFFVDACYGLAIYFGIFLSAVVILIVFFTATVATHHVPVQPTVSSQAESAPATPLPLPAPDDPASPLAKSRLQFDSKTMHAIAPQTPLDLLLWLAVSFTAGFCEEHIFRGYLLTQAIAFVRRAGMPHVFSLMVSIVFTSLLFGSLHLYEGTGGALIIAALGAIYSVLALKLGNLRAVIAAHFLQDFCAGVFLFFAHARLAH